MKKLIFWEVNELNFDYINFYISHGKLPNWKKFIDQHGLQKTYSEKKYRELEPWIQWPTVRTGFSHEESKIFRLGDMERSDIRQHWEILEDQGYTVAAISPINGSNKTRKSPFWIPDPGNVNQCVVSIRKGQSLRIDNNQIDIFIKEYAREKIMKEMASHILTTL